MQVKLNPFQELNEAVQSKGKSVKKQRCKGLRILEADK